MAQTGYTPILIYSSSTAAQAPAVGNLTNSTLGSELAINITDGKLFYKDNANAVQVIAWKVTPTTAGGTGLTSYTAGDLLYYATGTTLTKLGIGSAYQHLGVNAGGTAPEWQASANSVLTAQGDMLYASAANTLARLAKNTTATRYLSNTGSNNNPAWAQVDLTNGVTGTLPVGNGGTGLATLTANRVLYASATNTVGTSANLTFDGTTLQITSGSFNLGAGGANGFISGNTWYGINSGDWVFQAGNASQGFRWNGSSGGVRMYLDINNNLLLGTTSSPAGSGNFLINNGNVIQGTAAKGVTTGGSFALGLGANGSTTAAQVFPSGGVSIGNTTDPGATNLSVTGNILGGSGKSFIANGNRTYYSAAGFWDDTVQGNACGVGCFGGPAIGPLNGAGAATDNTINLGSGTYRWKTVFAGTATINTSDANEKQDIESLDDAELAVAKQIKLLIKKFKFKDAVKQKGNDARVHFGVLAQEIESAFAAQNLDASKYGLFCKDEWYEIDGKAMDENMKPYTADTNLAVKKTRLGVRYEELFAFVIAAM